jgi:hypothetical protein
MESFLAAFSVKVKPGANKASAGKGAVASRLHVAHFKRAVPEMQRWGKKMRYFAIILGAVLAGCSVEQDISSSAKTARRFPVPFITDEPTAVIPNPFEGSTSPIMAVWEDSPGLTADTNYPYLRVAVWPDGRVVFARDPNVWNHDLLIGQISTQAMAKLKQDIRLTGVFDLKGHCYLVPDAPVDCVMLSFGNSQMLYWDEIEHASHGINGDPKPEHLAFKKAWWDVNRLLLTALPVHARTLQARFQRPPKEWYLER